MATLIHESSVSQTVNAVAAALFLGEAIGAAERKRVARWLAARQGLPGAYANTFAGFDDERASGIRVVTGEQMTSASARHILGEECMRALRLLDVSEAKTTTALETADAGMRAALDRAGQDPRNTNPGTFCCGKCTVAMWRNLLAGGLDRQGERLEKGLGWLKSLRQDGGKWQRFPFWYTVLALTDMTAADVRGAAAELKHARATIDRTARRKASGATGGLRKVLAERALDAIGG